MAGPAQSAKEWPDVIDARSNGYQRDQLSSYLSMALENAGREQEIADLYEREARNTGSYPRLVGFLIEQKRIADAQRWAAEGIRKTYRSLPGIAKQLVDELGNIAASQKKWDVVAAHAAATFFEMPDSSQFEELITAAEKAGHGKAVRAMAEAFLETGKAP